MPNPKNLKEYYLQQRALFQPVLDAPHPNYLDLKVPLQQIHNHIDQLFIANDHKAQVDAQIHEALKTLSDDALKALYAKISNPKTDKRVTEDFFLSQIRSDHSALLLNESLTGRSLEELLDFYDKALGPEKVQTLIHTPIRPHPLSTEFKEPMTYQPYAEDIENLRKKFTDPKDPAKNQELDALLQKVSASLEEVQPKLLLRIDGARTLTSAPGYESVDNVNGRRADQMQGNGLKSLGKGAFKDLVVPEPGADGRPTFSLLDDGQYPNPMTQEQLQNLETLSADPKVGMSSETRSVVKELSGYLEEMQYMQHSGAALTGQNFPMSRPTAENNTYLPAEEGIKYYAFRPLHNRKAELIAAVKAGDLERVRQAQENYEKTERTLDKIMGLLKSDRVSQEPLFSPNVESTRSTTGDLPEKYLLDTTNQRKLNSIYVAFVSLKNAGLSLEDLCADPAGTARKIGQQYLATNGVNARPESIGATLQHVMQGANDQGNAGLAYLTAWTLFEASMLRGISGLIGLEKDPAKAGEFMAAFHLGMRQATLDVRKEEKRYNTISEANTGHSRKAVGMRGVIYQNAALRPLKGDDALNMEQLVDRLGQPDQLLVPGIHPKNAAPDQIRYAWQNEKDALNQYADGSRLYDWTELASRNRKVLEDAAQEQKNSATYRHRFDPDLYLIHAFHAQSRLAKNAGLHGENSPDFEAFRQSVRNTYTLAKDPDIAAILKMGAVLMDDPKAYDFLQTGKQDQIVKSDSPEYRDMKRSLAKVQKVKELITGGDPTKLEELYNSEFSKDLEKAKEDAFTYVRLKYKNGTKRSFHYASGERRAQEGLQNYRKLLQLQSDMGLLSPAQKIYEEARMELLQNRSDRHYLYGGAGKAALAKMLYAKSYLEAGIPAEHQQEAFSQQKLQAGVNKLLSVNLQPFRNPAELETLADQALEHKGLFAEAVNRRATGLQTSYNNLMAKPRLKEAVHNCALGFAMDQACTELRIDHSMQSYSAKNPEIRRKAETIMKDPIFQESIRMLTKGKTAEEIRKLHKPAGLDNTAEGQQDFYKCKLIAKYERRCACIAAEASLRHKNPDKEPTQAEIDKAAEAFRKDQRFQKLVQEKEQAFHNPQDFENATNKLNFAEHRTQFLGELSQRFTAPVIQPQNNGNVLQNSEILAPGPQGQGGLQPGGSH